VPLGFPSCPRLSERASPGRSADTQSTRRPRSAPRTSRGVSWEPPAPPPGRELRTTAPGRLCGAPGSERGSRRAGSRWACAGGAPWPGAAKRPRAAARAGAAGRSPAVCFGPARAPRVPGPSRRSETPGKWGSGARAASPSRGQGQGRARLAGRGLGRTALVLAFLAPSPLGAAGVWCASTASAGTQRGGDAAGPGRQTPGSSSGRVVAPGAAVPGGC
jgi:hypothetical protein